LEIAGVTARAVSFVGAARATHALHGGDARAQAGRRAADGDARRALQGQEQNDQRGGEATKQPKRAFARSLADPSPHVSSF
jgi:hypothetical protein